MVHNKVKIYSFLGVGNLLTILRCSRDRRKISNTFRLIIDLEIGPEWTRAFRASHPLDMLAPFNNFPCKNLFGLGSAVESEIVILKDK